MGRLGSDDHLICAGNFQASPGSQSLQNAPDQAGAVVQALSGHRLLVIGDAVLDEYVYGRPERLSREAAIPVLLFERRRVIPGGAANPATNIAALGSYALLLAQVGADPAASELRAVLQEQQVDVAGLLESVERPTTTKTRILASVQLTVDQQVARLDRIERGPPSADLQARAQAVLQTQLPSMDAVVCSDYRIGWLTDELIRSVREWCSQHKVRMIVDSQGRFEPYRGADFLKCNLAEASGWLGSPLRSDADVAQGLQAIRERLELGAVVVTRGGAGFSLLDQTGLYHEPAVPIGEVFDATGAGDTFVAVSALGLCAGWSPLRAARLANLAAAQVVRRIGVATVAPEELFQAIERHDGSSLY